MAYFSWEYITVLAKPRNVTIKPLRTSYEVNEQLKCEADGNPEPTFYWTNLATDNVYNGSILILRSDLLTTSGQNVSFRCTAINLVGGNKETSYTNITFTLDIDNAGTFHGFDYIYEMHAPITTQPIALFTHLTEQGY